MDWNELRNGVYNIDGSWRDIYVLNATKEDWKKWVEYVGTNFKVSWYAEDHNSGIAIDRIDSLFIENRWDYSECCATTVSIFLNKIQINCHFFTESQIENDINPKEIESIDDHNRVMSYMKSISKILVKEVILTEENREEAVLVRVNEDNVCFI